MYTLIRGINLFFEIVTWLIIARVILSWVGPNVQNMNWKKVIIFIYNVTEPILGPIRNILPTTNMGIDFSPLVAIFALSIIKNFIIRILI
ncbi:MAG: YggT family protein [Bacillota bacterium]